MFLLRETDRSVTDICFDVGFTSLGTFSRTFREIVGETPSGYRAGARPDRRAPLRPAGGDAAARWAAAERRESSSFGEATAACGP